MSAQAQKFTLFEKKSSLWVSVVRGLEDPDQTWVWPGWPVLASLLLASYLCNSLMNFTVHTFLPKLSLLYFCH